MSLADKFARKYDERFEKIEKRLSDIEAKAPSPAVSTTLADDLQKLRNEIQGLKMRMAKS